MGTGDACKAVGHRPQDRLPLASGGRRSAAGRVEWEQPIAAISVLVGAPSDRDAAMAWVSEEIAEQLVRSPSTISRELRRNTAADDHSYDGELTHARARDRACRPPAGRLGGEWEGDLILGRGDHTYLRERLPGCAAFRLTTAAQPEVGR